MYILHKSGVGGSVIASLRGKPPTCCVYSMTGELLSKSLWIRTNMQHGTLWTPPPSPTRLGWTGIFHRQRALLSGKQRKRLPGKAVAISARRRENPGVQPGTHMQAPCDIPGVGGDARMRAVASRASRRHTTDAHMGAQHNTALACLCMAAIIPQVRRLDKRGGVGWLGSGEAWGPCKPRQANAMPGIHWRYQPSTPGAIVARNQRAGRIFIHLVSAGDGRRQRPVGKSAGVSDSSGEAS